MKLTILVENTSKINKSLLAEPALSFYIELKDNKILFDCGYSNAFIQNAFVLGIDLRKTTDIVFSHAHNDHTGGLYHLMQLMQTSLDLGLKIDKMNLIAHPDIFIPRLEENFGNSGFPVAKDDLQQLFNVKTTETPYWITDKLCFLAQIPTITPTTYEYKDDSAIVYKSDRGLVIITGCSHSGLKNIVEYAKKITSTEHIHTLIGGFHLIRKSKIEIEVISKYLKSQNIENIYPCHCVNLPAKLTMSQILNIQEASVGDVFEF